MTTNQQKNRSKSFFPLLLFLLFSFFSVAQTQKPDVVFIIADDLNDYEDAFGGHLQVKTPNIDKLAKSGISFTNAHSNCPVCAPSRNSLFTGVFPYEWENLAENEKFLAKIEELKQVMMAIIQSENLKK